MEPLHSKNHIYSSNLHLVFKNLASFCNLKSSFVGVGNFLDNSNDLLLVGDMVFDGDLLSLSSEEKEKLFIGAFYLACSEADSVH